MEMDKVYKHQEIEGKIYELWEKGGYFTPKIDPKKKPFTILLPLPNANDPMHMGHALFTVQDILVRYHRMLGEPTLWLPGGDHAGIETQYVFEKKLAKEDKSRFDFDRDTLYKMIEEYAENNKDINKNQMKRLGFSLDWTRYHYSLEPKIIETVFDTFRKLYEDGLVYRAERLVNYCTKCGTAFSDLEINYIERQDPLYYIKYGPFVLATTRPETKFGDTAVAFHPGDKRYQKYLGKTLEIEGVNGPFKVIAVSDDAIDPKFGTGIEKVTPAHDAMDFDIAQRHHLPIKKVINPDGKLNETAGKFAGLRVKAAREAVYNAMQEMGLIDHVDKNYVHRIATCYRCGTNIEPMVMPQWYVKTEPLAKAAIDAVKKGKTKIAPLKRFEKLYFDWLENIHDWNISRQIVWGPRMPVWYCLDDNPDIQVSFIDKSGQKIKGLYKDLKDKYSPEEINKGLQSLIAPINATFFLDNNVCKKCGGKNLLQETDTFDTWFLSGQWPLTTLGFPDNADFKYFYPTSVLDTLWDILFFWVARMMMLGIYRTGKVPFEVIHLHSRVVDKFGKKMAKSKGNVINPIEMVDKYGADALRFALTFGAAPGNDISVSEDKVRGMRNFSNKLWNIGRFLDMNFEAYKAQKIEVPFFTENLEGQTKEDKEIIKELNKLIKKTTKNLDTFHFSDAAQTLYEFVWHKFADIYVEYSKERLKDNDPVILSVLRHVFLNVLKLLNPFMPFITEELWEKMPRKYDIPLIVSSWPKV